MKLYIHTYGRPHKQVTLDNMPEQIRKMVCLVVQNREAFKYPHIEKEYGCEVLVLPKGITKLSPTRQWLLENCPDEHMGLLDDDLVFFKRDSNTTKLSKMKAKDFTTMLKLMANWLNKGYIHCGISAREGNNHVTEPFAECTRMMRALFYSVGDVNSVGARFDRVVTKQDFDMTLQLLRKGFPNRVAFSYAQNQAGGSNSEGGCATYRTSEVMRKSAEKLAKLHPGFVKVVEKETKSAWGGGVRIDVRVSWKKAFESHSGDK